MRRKSSVDVQEVVISKGKWQERDVLQHVGNVKNRVTILEVALVKFSHRLHDMKLVKLKLCFVCRLLILWFSIMLMLCH
ncbi:hypothetical protein HanXRQr2_Chr13g0582381 [Helianthus annuus]|uniref:Uncharacterized protein n=1 Tax=Helianthus annuus TaxID=4232 RepID=A0A9K3EHA2_HELAN|nr:hypothetical protein HanXRQr2_Chr13g0582381 [Helianthus annuus]